MDRESTAWIHQSEIKTENAHHKYNFVVGAGKYVIDDIENSPTQKTKIKENVCSFLSFMFSLLRVFQNKLVCEFSKCQIADAVFCLIMIFNCGQVWNLPLQSINLIAAIPNQTYAFLGRFSWLSAQKCRFLRNTQLNLYFFR